MKMKPFEFLVLLHPEQNDDGKDIGDTKIIVERQFVLSKDDKTAAMSATRAIPKDHDNALDRVEIIVRPF